MYRGQRINERLIARGHFFPVSALSAVSLGGGSTLAATGSRGGDCNLLLWRTSINPSGELSSYVAPLTPHPGERVLAVSLLSDELLLAGGGTTMPTGGTLYCHDLATGAVRSACVSSVAEICFIHTTKRLPLGTTGQDRVGRHAVIGLSNDRVVVVDLGTLSVVPSVGGTVSTTITSLALCPVHPVAAVGLLDGNVQLLSLVDRSGSNHQSSGGSITNGSVGGGGGSVLQATQGRQGVMVTSLAYSADGKTLATCVGLDIVLWQMDRLKPLASLKGHEGPVLV